MGVEPTLLRVEETATTEIVAIGARLRVTVAGQGSWNGNAAAERSAEVRALVTALLHIGVPESAVSLRGVTLHGESGIFGRNTRARYALRIRLDALERLGAVLTLLSEQKNVSMDELGWRFDEESARRDLVRVAIASAKARAILMADALDMDLCGIKSVADRAGASQDVRHEQSASYTGMVRSKVGSADPEIAVLGTRTLLHTVTLEALALPRPGVV